MQKYNLLLNTMRESLLSAVCGLDGKNLVTEEIAHLLSSIKENDIPDCWEGVAYPTLDNLEDFVGDLVSAKWSNGPNSSPNKRKAFYGVGSYGNAFLWRSNV